MGKILKLGCTKLFGVANFVKQEMVDSFLLPISIEIKNEMDVSIYLMNDKGRSAY